MTSEIKVPTLPESIADATIVTWHKKVGDAVSRDEVLVEVETDKVVLEVPAAEDGVIGSIIEDEGATVLAHQVIGTIEAGSGAAAAKPAAAAAGATAATEATDDGGDGQTSPSVRRLLDEHGLSASDVKGSGRNGRISKEDVERHVASAPAGAPQVASSAVVYHGYCDIGVAVSSERGLVVPVVRNTEFMGLADIEKSIADYAGKARDGKLSIEEMTGGTFTVSNGGVFGSLLSTPILNPPQSAILGMHATQDRPIAVNGEVVIRPMMYVALSYDHRIVDGKGAVGFLKTIKELVEDPARIVFDL